MRSARDSASAATFRRSCSCGAHPDDRRDRAARRGHHAAVGASDRDSRDGCIRQHARNRCRTQSHRRGAEPRRERSSTTCPRARGSGSSPLRRRRPWCSLPTNNREDILAAIDRFQLQRGTAVGSGILVSLKMLFPDVEFDLRSSNPRAETPAQRVAGPEPEAGQACIQASAARFVHCRGRHLLLTDGQTTTGPDPIEAARMAADRGVTVYTVGIGTTSRRTHRRGRLVDARAPRRGVAQDHREPDAR